MSGLFGPRRGAAPEGRPKGGKLRDLARIIRFVTPYRMAIMGSLVALVGAAAMGGTQAGFMTLTHMMIQAITPDGIRGRVSGVYSVHIGGVMALTNFGNGALADVMDAGLLLLASGILFAVIIIVSWRSVALRQIYTNGLQVEAHAPNPPPVCR